MKIVKTQKGCLSLLGGKTDMGKSTIACYDCAEKLKEDKSVVFFSYEYCQSIIYNKLVTHFGMKYQDLFKLNVIDCTSTSFNAIVDIIKKYKDTVDAFYIDFLDLMAKTTDKEYANYTNFQKLELKQKMLAELAQIAYEAQVEIIVLTRVHGSLDIPNTIDYLNMLSSLSSAPEPIIRMFLGKDAEINPMIKGGDLVNVIIIEGTDLIHFSSINLKQAYRD